MDLVAPEGTVYLGGALCPVLGRLANGNDLASHQVTLCRLPFPAGGDQPRGMAVLPLPAQPAHGRGDAGRARHHREPRERAEGECSKIGGVRRGRYDRPALPSRQRSASASSHRGMTPNLATVPAARAAAVIDMKTLRLTIISSRFAAWHSQNGPVANFSRPVCG